MSRPPWNPATSDGCSVPWPFREIPECQEFAAAIRDLVCLPHDRAYHCGGSEYDRLLADVVFFYRALRVARRKLPTWSDENIALWATRFYRAVRLGGGPHFNYAEGQGPPEPEPIDVKAMLEAWQSA